MYKMCLIALLAVPAAVYAQSGPVDSSSTSSSTSISAPAPAGGSGDSVAAPAPQDSKGFFRRTMMPHSVHDAPAGSFTASYLYEYSPDTDGANRSLMGWSAVPEVNFNKYLGLQADFAGLYMRGVGFGQNRFMAAAGPRVNFAPHARIRPYVFAEGGEVRLSTQQNDIKSWNPVATGGVGFDYKLSRGLAFNMVPGEYMGQKLDDGTWTHSFVSRAGITFNFYNR